MEKIKIRMLVSAARTDERGCVTGYQVGEVVFIEQQLAIKWVRSKLAEHVDQNTPLSADEGWYDLCAEEVRQYNCANCERVRAEVVFRNKPYCQCCYFSVREL